MMPVQPKTINRTKTSPSRRRIRVPGRTMFSDIKNPHLKDVHARRMQKNIYTDIKRPKRIAVYVKAFLIYLTIPVLMHIAVAVLMGIATVVLGEHQPMPPGAWTLLTPMYIVGGALAFWRINDNMAHYNRLAIVNKHSINRHTQTLYFTIENTSMSHEIKVAEKYRKRYNKYVLFPTSKEINVVEQWLKDAEGTDVHSNRMDIRRNFSIDNIMSEHIAARDIAQLKQNLHGGPNEYRSMMKKYKHRAAPEIRTMLDHNDF